VGREGVRVLGDGAVLSQAAADARR
jgi:hypothetical protein